MATTAAAVAGALVGGLAVRSVLSKKTSRSTRKTRRASNALIREQLARNTAFWGEKKQKKVEGAFVVVVGVGGVGSHAAHMLARSGVRRFA